MFTFVYEQPLFGNNLLLARCRLASGLGGRGGALAEGCRLRGFRPSRGNPRDARSLKRGELSWLEHPTSSRKEKAAKEGSHRRAADVLRVLAALAEPAGRHATPLGHRRHARASDRHSPRHPPHRGALQLQSMRSARDAQLHCNRVWKPHLPTSRPLQSLSSEKLAAQLVATRSRGPTRDCEQAHPQPLIPTYAQHPVSPC